MLNTLCVRSVRSFALRSLWVRIPWPVGHVLTGRGGSGVHGLAPGPGDSPAGCCGRPEPAHVIGAYCVGLECNSAAGLQRGAESVDA